MKPKPRKPTRKAETVLRELSGYVLGSDIHPSVRYSLRCLLRELRRSLKQTKAR